MQLKADGRFRLSSQQRALWAQVQRGSGPPENGECWVRVSGPVCKARLERAINSVIARHEILRTTFFPAAGSTTPLQNINEPANERLECVTTDGGRETQARDPELHGLRALLISRGPGEHLLRLTAPVLSLDLKSYRLLLDEISTVYTHSDAMPSDLPEPLQYADYTGSEDVLFETETASIGRAFWRSVLAENGDEPESEAAEPRHSVRATINSITPPDVVSKIEGIASDNNAPARAVFLACWGILHSRTGGAVDPLLTCRHTGRGYPELDTAFGLFEKYLPLRLKLRSYRRFDELLTALGDTLRDHDNWHLSYPADVEARPVLLAPSFGWDDGVWTHETGEVRFVEERISAGRHYVPSDLRCRRSDNSVDLVFTFAADSIPADEAELVVERFESILHQVARSAAILIDDIDVLTRHERRLLAELNHTKRDYGDPACVHGLFERQAATAPDGLSLVYEDEQISYGALNEAANRLAHYLIKLGVGAEMKVALCMERGVETVVGLLAVLKAGGAYVPVEPSQPPARLAQMLEHAQAVAVLTQERLKGQLPSTWAQVLCIDSYQAEWEDEPSTDPSVNLCERGLAYVIYTSGSTGRPKGVGIEHAQLVNYVKAVTERLKLERGCRMALLSTMAADLGHTMLYTSLCIGGELHVISEERARDKTMWEQYQEQRQVACMKITPTHAEALMQEPEALPRRLLVLGGEACSRDWIRRVKAAAPLCEVVNHYGPTECTVGAVTHCVDDRAAGAVPIGVPLSNVRVYVLDEGGRAVPMHIPGELYIGGACVGRGYLNDAERTSERFVPDGASGEEGSRLYRTGDRVRWGSDASLEYLGRLDRQVKIHGHRIEMGEIETVLAECPAVKQCAAIVREEETGGRRLTAYVVPSGDKKPTGAELREYLRGRLPEYMVPWSFAVLDRLPLTPNGKLDRAALAAAAAAEVVTESYEPLTPVEEILAGIWSEVLKRERVNAQENFFELGGHSLLATQVVSRVRDVLGVEVPLKVIFESPTVSGLARAVERERRTGSLPDAPAIRAAGRDVELPLSFAQQRLWFIQQLDPESSAYNMLRALRLHGPLAVPVLKQSLQEITRRHEALRTRLLSRGGHPLQVIEEACEIELPIRDVSSLDAPGRDERAREIVEQEARRPFDLQRGPVWRATLVRLAAQDHMLVVCLHHAASDGWSIAVLIKEFAALYDDYSNGLRSRLPELSLQYADFAVWQREWLTGEVLRQQMDYWRAQLAGAPALELPTDRPRPAAPSRKGATVPFRLSPELTRGLKDLSRREAVTLFMTLLAAFKVLLGQYTGQDDVTVGTNIANRNRADIEKIIGFFINNLILRTDMSGDPTFKVLLSRVRETTLGAYAHQDLPFEKLVEELQPERSLSHMPLFQVLFVLQNMPAESLQTSGLTLSAINVERGVSKFDLTLFMAETEQGLAGAFEYDTDLFDASTAERMRDDFQALLTEIVADPDSTISSYSAASEDQYTGMLLG